MRMRVSPALACALALSPALALAAAGDPALTVAVSSPSSYNQEALEGLRLAWNGPVSTGPAKDAAIVAAFGSAAALALPPGPKAGVVVLAPGFSLPAGGRTSVVSMFPDAKALAEALAAARPGLARVAVLWSSPHLSEEIAALAGARGKVRFVSARVVRQEDLPLVLRALEDVDAVWLAPDPQLLTPWAGEIIARGERARGRPAFAPTKALTAFFGASASVPFAEMGRLASEAGRELLSGAPGRVWRSGRVEVRIAP